MELVRRTMRYLRKRYPVQVQGEKTPVTIDVLHAILPLLPGWPDMGQMSASDRVFAAESVVAVTGLLRGGEFLASARSDRGASWQPTCEWPPWAVERRPSFTCVSRRHAGG